MSAAVVLRTLVATTIVLAAACFAAAADAPADAQRAAQVRFFETRVRPLLAEHCYQCHGTKKQESELRVDTWAGLMAGGASGPAVVPSKPGQSLLLSAVRHEASDLQMPPDGKLSDQQIRWIERWINDGAVHPDAGATPAIRPRRVDIEAGRRHWAFQPLSTPALPTVSNRDWTRNEIDHFILARLEQAGLQPAPSADRRTLIRRATFDMTGLPPTPAEVDDFVNDTQPGAWQRVVDRLLASPRYGPRWGRHWLDVARYADSNGLDENIAFGNAWRYRDYVIDSFDADRPLDQFLTEQLAGDQLNAAEINAAEINAAEINAAETSPADEITRQRRLIATGFLSLGPKVLAEVDETKMEMDIIDEQIDTVGRALLGLTLGCARCHDHKFDPIPTRDYYALAGVFKSTKTMDHFTKIARWHEHSIATPQQATALAQHAAQVAALKDQLAALSQPAAAGQTREPDSDNEAEPKTTNPEPSGEEPASATPASEEAAAKDAAAKEAAAAKARAAKLAALKKQLADLEKNPPDYDSAMGVSEREAANVPVHIRGSHLTLGDVVPRGFPQVLSDPSMPSIPADHSGRLQFARWLVAPQNPLPRRVLVNRVWRWHFGTGLTRSTDNFGTLGQPPTHPLLLDWLAQRLTRDDWSLKRLHRVILLSSTYRMSDRYDARAAAVDPENRLHWRHPIQRLQAESIRDSVLAIGGMLDESRGGSMLHVKNREFLFNHTSKDETNYDSRRRSVYLPVIRNHLYDVFLLFDYADATVLNGDRPTTTVASQALFLMNSELVADAARSWAERVQDQHGSDPQRLTQMYLEAFGRPPTQREAERTLRFLRARQTAANAKPVDAWSAVAHVLLSTNELIFVR